MAGSTKTKAEAEPWMPRRHGSLLHRLDPHELRKWQIAVGAVKEMIALGGPPRLESAAGGSFMRWSPLSVPPGRPGKRPEQRGLAERTISMNDRPAAEL